MSSAEMCPPQKLIMCYKYLVMMKISFHFLFVLYCLFIMSLSLLSVSLELKYDLITRPCTLPCGV